MDYTEKYLGLIESTKSDIRELNAQLATANSIMQMWSGVNIHIVETYCKIAQKTKELEELCEGSE